MKIYKSKWFNRFSRKNEISNEMLVEAVKRAEIGHIDADLGKGVIKQRIARTGQSRSRGYRTIIVIRRADCAFFVYGFAKKDKDNLRSDEEEAFKDMAQILLSLSDMMLKQLLEKGDFTEVKDD